jgi:hypothetical protein
VTNVFESSVRIWKPIFSAPKEECNNCEEYSDASHFFHPTFEVIRQLTDLPAPLSLFTFF